MKCNECRKEIKQHEVNKMVARTVQDGVELFFGFTQPDGTWAQRRGKLTDAYHWKCWNVVRKRSERTGEVTQMATGVAPNAYTIERMDDGQSTVDTSFLTERTRRRLDLAEEMGVGSDSWTVRELDRAIGKGVVEHVRRGYYISDGYPHTHSLPVAEAGLLRHLQYGHGFVIGTDGDNDPADIEHHGVADLKLRHSELHAWMSSQLIEQSRVDDDGLESEPGAGLEWPAGGTSTVEL